MTTIEFKEAVHDFRMGCLSIAENSNTRYTKALQTLLRFAEQNCLLVTQATAGKWLADKANTRSKATVNLNRTALVNFCRWCYSEKMGLEWLVPDRPRTPARPRIAPAPREHITQEEYEKIIAYLTGLPLPPPWDWAAMFVQAAWETGARLCDVGLFQWSMVRDQSIRYIPGKTKWMAKELEVPLSDDLWAKLIAYRARPINPLDFRADFPKAADYLFPHAAYWVRYNGSFTLSTKFASAFRKAGVNKTFHCLRHAKVTHMLEAGESIAMVQAFTGHSVQTLMRYSHIGLEAKRKALARTTEFLQKEAV